MHRSRSRAVAAPTQLASALPAIRGRWRATLLVALVAALAVSPTAAAAGGPATVTVRVEGLNGQTLLPQTQVTTNTTLIPVESGTCSGTSAGGALYDAVHGNWKAKNDGPEFIEIDGIGGLNFPPFSAEHPPDAFWAFWLNNQLANNGACGEQVASGADIVFVAQCEKTGPDCPFNATAPDHFLTVSSPSAQSVNVGESVSVTVGSISTAFPGAVEKSLPPTVTLSDGSLVATPNSSGVATLTFTSPGSYALQARAPDSVPSDPVTVCVHNGNDGTCGTSVATQGSTGTGSAQISVQATKQGSAPVQAESARVVGIANGRVYSRRGAPRLLAGVLTVPAGDTLRDVRIRLERRHRKRCFDFSGPRAAFVRSRHCARARFFSVGDAESFTYLLPTRLAPGHYVYAVEGVDNAGKVTPLIAGTSLVAFTVR